MESYFNCPSSIWSYKKASIMYIQKLIVVSDASCFVSGAHKPGRSGRGKAACGVVFLAEIKNIDNLIGEKGRHLGEMTVPEAEYSGLIFALDCASEYCRNEIEVWLDSELVVRHLNGTYRLKAKNLRPLFDKVKSLESRYKLVTYFHHSRDNDIAKKADSVAKQFQN